MTTMIRFSVPAAFAFVARAMSRLLIPAVFAFFALAAVGIFALTAAQTMATPVPVTPEPIDIDYLVYLIIEIIKAILAEIAAGGAN